MFKGGDKVKVGDRGIVIGKFQGMEMLGARALVINLDDEGRYGLDIDGWSGGHDCGVLPDHASSGWWVPAHCFKKLTPFKGNIK